MDDLLLPYHTHKNFPITPPEPFLGKLKQRNGFFPPGNVFWGGFFPGIMPSPLPKINPFHGVGVLEQDHRSRLPSNPPSYQILIICCHNSMLSIPNPGIRRGSLPCAAILIQQTISRPLDTAYTFTLTLLSFPPPPPLPLPSPLFFWKLAICAWKNDFRGRKGGFPLQQLSPTHILGESRFFAFPAPTNNSQKLKKLPRAWIGVAPGRRWRPQVCVPCFGLFSVPGPVLREK